MTAKQSMIRPGQRKPYRKATRKQIELRIESAALLLFLGLSKPRFTKFSESFTEPNGGKPTDTWLLRAHAMASNALLSPLLNGSAF
jgi:hypothetical protein